MELESREGAGATRSQNVVHILDRDHDTVAALMAGTIERAVTGGEGTRMLVVVPSVDDALALSAILVDGAIELPSGAIVPVSSAGRARRTLAHAPAVVIATPGDLAVLVEQSTFKFEALRAVSLVWLEQLLGEKETPALESLLGEVPREAERIAFATTLDETADAFLDRSMWRARRVSHLAPAVTDGGAVRFVVTTAAARGDALRGVLDALDPAAACVIVCSESSAAEARQALARLGYDPDVGPVRISLGLPGETDAQVIFFDEPPDAEALRATSTGARTAVALVGPSRVARLRAMAGADCAPLAQSRAFQAARAAEDLLREELRGLVRSGIAQPQLALLEPLCGEFDSAEVAAAALYLVLRERRRRVLETEAAAQAPPPSARGASTPPAASGMTRLYFNVGERDGVRPADLVGAIAGESGITGSQVGRIDLHESHAIVEVETAVAERVVERMSGATVRGRRIVAREDQAREGAPRGPRSGGGEHRGPRAGGGEHRGPRGAGGDRRGSRGGAGEHRAPRAGAGERRGPRPDAGDRAPVRAAEPDRLPRAVREADEWSDRAERLRQARRPPREEA